MRKLIYAFVIVMTVFACSEEDIAVLDEATLEQEASGLSNDQGRIENPYVRPLYDSDRVTSENCNVYEAYAAVGTYRKNYDRRVTITVSESGRLLRQLDVTIRANQSTSEKKDILRNATEDYSSVKLEVTRVTNLSTGAVDNSASWDDITFNPDNCFTEEQDGGSGIIQCPVPCEIGHPGGGYLGFD